MKKNHLIYLVLLLFTFHHLSYGQNFSKQVNDFIAIQDSIVIIKNVTLIDGSGGPTKYNQDILFINNQITAIGNTGKISIPKNAKIIDGIGKTVIPGLIMMHEHLFYAKTVEGKRLSSAMPNTFPQMYLAGGVTTMRTAGSNQGTVDLNVKNLITKGTLIGPTIDITTPLISKEIPYD